MIWSILSSLSVTSTKPVVNAANSITCAATIPAVVFDVVTAAAAVVFAVVTSPVRNESYAYNANIFSLIVTIYP